MGTVANRVTVGLDGSPESTAAARWAAHEAELRGASLDLVHAEEWLENPPLPVATTEDRRRWAEAVLRDSAEDVRRVHPSLKVDTRRVSGLPSLALTHAAEDSDMLVLGSRALGSVAGFLVGSTGFATVTEAARPVVLVRSVDRAGNPPDGARDRGPIVDSRATVGQPAIQILDVASAAALIVVGRRIRHSAFGTHIDPITHAVMHHAVSPVAVIAHE
ncbi:universal stress protein [Streptomyces sp. XY332]|uniref:universal stress protein n=1 Tax=Streptomyces sp. XY332 TaxID=1415561 RepID=UPI00099C59CE|nr:universal stress protein [Streptomyces sp. XY332]